MVHGLFEHYVAHWVGAINKEIKLKLATLLPYFSHMRSLDENRNWKLHALLRFVLWPLVKALVNHSFIESAFLEQSTYVVS